MMTICNNYVKSCHRALSAIIYIYMYFVWTIALNSHMHAHIYGSVHDYRYAPTSMRTLIHNLTKLKFAGTEKKWPNLRGRAVEVRALTQPICNLWAAKTNYSDKNDVLIKMLLERSCEYDQVIIDHPDVPRLDDQAPRHIYIHTFFLFRYSAFVHFVLFICTCICTVGQFEVARRLQSVATEFIALYKAAKTAWGLLGDYFCITKKFHDLFHLAQRADEINPALTSCMQHEDLMGKIKKLMIKCVQSAKPITAVHKAITKYRLALHLEHR